MNCDILLLESSGNDFLNVNFNEQKEDKNLPYHIINIKKKQLLLNHIKSNHFYFIGKQIVNNYEIEYYDKRNEKNSDTNTHFFNFIKERLKLNEFNIDLFIIQKLDVNYQYIKFDNNDPLYNEISPFYVI